MGDNSLPSQVVRFESIPLDRDDALEIMDPLTPFQLDILGLVTAGLQNQEISSEIHRSTATVKGYYIGGLFNIMNVRDRPGIRSIASSGGLLVRALETEKMPYTQRTLEKNGLGRGAAEIMCAYELTINDLHAIFLRTKGMINAEVAQTLSVDTSTLKRRMGILLKKLGVTSMLEAQHKIGVASILDIGDESNF